MLRYLQLWSLWLNNFVLPLVMIHHCLDGHPEDLYLGNGMVIVGEDWTSERSCIIYKVCKSNFKLSVWLCVPVSSGWKVLRRCLTDFKFFSLMIWMTFCSAFPNPVHGLKDEIHFEITLREIHATPTIDWSCVHGVVKAPSKLNLLSAKAVNCWFKMSCIGLQIDPKIWLNQW